MVFGKNPLLKFSALAVGVLVSIFALPGCGGESSGAPSGIGGALTGATIRVSSFNLATAPTVNDLVSIEDPSVLPPNSTEIDGALYPTRNSHSFRVLLKGAGSSREDVVYYFDAYDPSHDPTVEGHVANQETDYIVHTPTVKEPWDLTVPARGNIPQIELRKVYFASRNDALKVESVIKDPKTGRYVYDFDRSPVPTSKALYYSKSGAYSYAQSTFRPSTRSGRRNVIVQFFNDTAENVKEEFEARIPASQPPDETTYLHDHLTNAYVFTTNIPKTQGEVSLTGSFQTNNGDNGLVDTNTIPVKVTGLPPNWGSVRFDMFEETTSPGNPGIVYTEIVDRTSPAETTASAFIRFANRQRVLKVYATCYEGKQGQGALLAQTKDFDTTETEDTTLYNTPTYPVEFIATPTALPGPLFPADSGGPSPADSATLLMSMTLATPDDVKLNASVAAVARATTGVADSTYQHIDVSITARPEPRYANGDDKPVRPALVTAALTLATSVTYTRLDSTGSGTFPGYVFSVTNATGVAQSLLGAIDAPTTDGRVRWQQDPSKYFFSRAQVPLGKSAAALVRVSAPTAGTTPLATLDLPVPLSPDLGTTAGTVN